MGSDTVPAELLIQMIRFLLNRNIDRLQAQSSMKATPNLRRSARQSHKRDPKMLTGRKAADG